MRRDKRTDIDEPARLHPNQWSSLEVRVLDLSASGFRADCEARVLVGSPIAIEIAGVGRVAAHVTWRRGNRFGAKFDVAIDLSACTWPALCDQVVLSRMLVERAQARQEGEFGTELELRRKILQSLPIKPVKGSEPAHRRSTP